MILHIPHAGTNTLGRNIEQFDIDYLTDWRTDELFKCELASSLVFPISRFVCDVERFPDEYEEMFKIGQGICYTKGTRDYDVKINYPYSGSMIPAKFVGNPDVFPIMIEVNKKLYLNNEDDFNKIKIVINQLLGVIAEYEDSFE